MRKEKNQFELSLENLTSYPKETSMKLLKSQGYENVCAKNKSLFLH